LTDALESDEAGQLSWACRILVRGDPDGDPRRADDFAEAYELVWSFAEDLLQTPRLSEKEQGLQARLAHGGDDVRQDLIVDLIFYLLRQEHCPGAGKSRDQLRRHGARRLAVRYRQGTASIDDLQKEARRWARNGMNLSELRELWRPLDLPIDCLDAAEAEGERDGGRDEKWRSLLYGKLSNLILDRHRKLTRQQRLSVSIEVEDLEGEEQDSWAIEALGELRDEVWTWLLETYVPELREAHPRRRGKLDAFMVYCQRLEFGRPQLSAAQIRRAGRGRDAVLAALHGDLAETVGAAQAETATGIRAWATALSSQPELNLAALACLLHEDSHLSHEQALRVVACSLMTHEGRMRRPRQESESSRPDSEEIH
jgi:hypothetical protein